MRAYACLVSIRKLFAILVALAVLFAPSVTYASMPAATPHHHGGQMMEMGDWQMQGMDMSQMDHSKMDHSAMAKGMACCCKDMAKGHDGEAADHAEHKDR